MNALKKIGKWVGYPLLFIFSFLLFSYLTFPYDRLKRRIIYEVETEPTPSGGRRASGMQMEIVDLSPSWFTGIEMSGVRIAKLPERIGDPTLDVTFPSIEARVGVLALLLGGFDLTLAAEVAGGTIDAAIEGHSSGLNVDAQIASVRLRRAPILRSFTPLPVNGTVDLNVDLDLNLEPSESNGEIRLNLSGVELGDGQSGLSQEFLQGMVPRAMRAFIPREGLMVQQMNAGDFVAQLDIEGGAGTITRMMGRGEHLKIDGEGEFTLGTPPATEGPAWPRLQRGLLNTRVDTLMRFEFDESYQNIDTQTQALFSLGQRAPGVWTPDMNAVQVRVNGAPGRFRYQPAGTESPPSSVSEMGPSAMSEMSAMGVRMGMGAMAREPGMALGGSAMNDSAMMAEME